MKNSSIKTWKYSTSYIPVGIIVPWLKWGDDGGNLLTGFVIYLYIHEKWSLWDCVTKSRKNRIPKVLL